MKKEVTEADSVKLLSDGGPALDGGNPKLGDKPRSIRKRGFWRAYKRGELWAVVSFATGKMLRDIEMALYGTKIVEDRYAPNNIIYLTYPIIGLSEIVKGKNG